jgi:hypothetical protein
MKKNIGRIDRWVRIVAGIIVLSLLIWLPGNQRWFGLIGLVPLITGIIGFCPSYALFGIRTNKDE